MLCLLPAECILTNRAIYAACRRIPRNIFLASVKSHGWRTSASGALSAPLEASHSRLPFVLRRINRLTLSRPNTCYLAPYGEHARMATGDFKNLETAGPSGYARTRSLALLRPVRLFLIGIFLTTQYRVAFRRNWQLQNQQGGEKSCCSCY